VSQTFLNWPGRIVRGGWALLSTPPAATLPTFAREAVRLDATVPRVDSDSRQLGSGLLAGFNERQRDRSHVHQRGRGRRLLSPERVLLAGVVSTMRGTGLEPNH
jgi:hypothetical protein